VGDTVLVPVDVPDTVGAVVVDEGVVVADVPDTVGDVGVVDDVGVGVDVVVVDGGGVPPLAESAEAGPAPITVTTGATQAAPASAAPVRSACLRLTPGSVASMEASPSCLERVTRSLIVTRLS
jgi:hypothetical protein